MIKYCSEQDDCCSRLLKALGTQGPAVGFQWETQHSGAGSVVPRILSGGTGPRVLKQ